KKALEATQKDLASTNKALANLKSTTDDDIKKATAKADALQKELDALKTAAKTALTKDDLDALSKKADAITADVTALKAAGGDAKATTEKLSAIEKSADEMKKTVGDVPGIKTEVLDDKGGPSKVTVARQRGDTAWVLAASALVMFMVP